LANQRTTKSHSSHGSPLVFWLLTIMGLAVFAPCIVLPEWRAYQGLRLAEQREQFKVDQVREAVADEQRRLEALRSDPAVVARLARREFAFHQPGEAVVTVPVASAPDPPKTFVPAPVEPPVLIKRWERFLPRLNYDRLFCDDETRAPLMGMSLSVIAIAFALFRRRSVAAG
jgi:cell division protein FtsB